MATGALHRESARILAFPNRFGLKADRLDAKGGPVASLGSPRLATVEYGSGWYHDDAINEDRDDAKQ